MAGILTSGGMALNAKTGRLIYPSAQLLVNLYRMPLNTRGTGFRPSGTVDVHDGVGCPPTLFSGRQIGRFHLLALRRVWYLDACGQRFGCYGPVDLERGHARSRRLGQGWKVRHIF